ncbi:MAG: hypothetical protein IKE63_06600 [Bacilli bacterium]|nr:hypothetical protein [Bacilli bacterium]
MKKFYITINIFLVIAIMTSLFVQPEHNNISTKHLSRSLDTASFKKLNFRKTELPEVEEKKDGEKEIDKDKPTNNITESVAKVENTVSNNVAEASVVTDVLERQVGPMSAYGPDCVGCSGHLATGFDARQSIEYQDPTYGSVRIVAGDRKYPFGTIVRISGTRLGTFNAIVLDRGGNIGIGKRFMFDLLCHNESEASGVGSFQNVTFEILRYGY